MTQPNSTQKTTLVKGTRGNVKRAKRPTHQTTPVKGTCGNVKRPTKKKQRLLVDLFLFGSTARELFPDGYQTPRRNSSERNECPERPKRPERPESPESQEHQLSLPPFPSLLSFD
jgi:hypothetical protein